MIASTGCEIHLTQPGSIANLTIRPQQMSARDRSTGGVPTLNEATINMQASGLNFRDVLNVLGLDPTRTLRPIGGEAAGIVSTVGPACGHVLPLERAHGLAPGSLRTRAWCDARYIRCMARTLGTAGTASVVVHMAGSVDSRARAQWYAGDTYL